jgi:hypothetical protein
MHAELIVKSSKEETASKGVEGVIRGLEGLHLADRCILTKLE